MKKRIIFGLLIFTFLVVLGFVLSNFFSVRKDNEQPEEQPNAKYDDLYEIKYNNDWLYINETGDVVLRFPVSEYDDVGTFIEGRAFLSKGDKEIKYDGDGADFYYKLTYLSIIDSNGNIVKKFDEPALVMESDGETIANFMPEFYRGYARIDFVSNDIDKIERYSQVKYKETYIDKMGEIVNKRDIPADVAEMFDSYMVARDRFEPDENLILKEMECTETFAPDWNRCFAYVDKNSNIVLKPKYNSEFTYCGDWYSKNGHFYNNRALVFHRTDVDDNVLRGYYYFINEKGESINNDRYSDIIPFYRKLTMVSDYETGEWVYINTDGKVVWSDEIQKERDKK